MHKKFWFETLKGKHYSEDVGIDWKIILEWILREIGWGKGGLDASGSG
jgi:hypothetical protein